MLVSLPKCSKASAVHVLGSSRADHVIAVNGLLPAFKVPARTISSAKLWGNLLDIASPAAKSQCVSRLMTRS